MRELFLTPCEILDIARKSDTCVKYEEESEVHQGFRLGLLVDPDGPYRSE